MYTISDLLALVYLAAAILFILGLRGLTSPATARRGNYYSIAGMSIAILATMASMKMDDYALVLGCIAVGAMVGTVVAVRIKMTAVPQLVALLHSFVGLAAGLVAAGVYVNRAGDAALPSVLMIEITAGTVIGLITFSGSLVAFGKLQGLIKSAPLIFRGRHPLNLCLALLVLLFGFIFVTGNKPSFLIAIWIVSILLGLLLITPIGGADMPVIISMLNSYSGWAAVATGFTLQNNLLVITGALVGCSGAILSYIMCKVMNRSILKVVFGGGLAAKSADTPASSAAGKGIKSAVPEEVVFWLDNAQKIIIVPGYGMAVAQAQHAIKGLLSVLEKRGKSVTFGIHPVAGRMPGHMNVLLAEADIPYDHVFEMDTINPEFVTTDAVLVVGANDVTNPAAQQDPSSPIYGMPILQVERAKQVFVIKRSMRPGYSGVENLLYYKDNCTLVFGDAKEVCESLIANIKAA